MYGIPAYEFIHHEGDVRTKQDHPYSYDPIRHYHARAHGDVGSAYDDRMQQWDSAKWRASAQIMNDKYGAGAWRLTCGPQAEEMLRLYYDAPSLVLTDLVEFCNQSSGYAHFSFCYVKEPDPSKPLSPEAPRPPKEARGLFVTENGIVNLG